MADTVTLPAVGSVKKQYVMAGGALVVGIVGYAYWQKAKTPPIEEYVVPLDQIVDPASSTTAGITTAANTSTPDPSTLPPGTPAEWSQRVVQALSEIGFEPDFIATTVGKYLARQELEQKEADLIRTAIALIGNVPGQEPYPIKVKKEAPKEEPKPTPTPTPNPTPAPAPAPAPAQRTVSLPHPMNIKQATMYYYGSYQWNGNGGRFYWANEGTIVSSARAHGVWKDYADFVMPAGTTLVLP